MSTAYSAWCGAVFLSWVWWLLRREDGNARILHISKKTVARVSLLFAVCLGGLVARAVVLVLFTHSASESAISILTIILTVVAAYGVYMSQLTDKKLREVETQLSAVRAQGRTTEIVKADLEKSLRKYRKELHFAMQRTELYMLRQTILAQLPEPAEVADNAKPFNPTLRSLVKHAVSRTSPREAEYDCEEVFAICASHSLEAEAALGKATAPFRQYHQLATRVAAEGGPDQVNW